MLLIWGEFAILTLFRVVLGSVLTKIFIQINGSIFFFFSSTLFIPAHIYCPSYLIKGRSDMFGWLSAFAWVTVTN